MTEKNNFVNSTMLKLSSFICGTIVMTVEMTGSRLLAPYMGTSIIIWTSLIGIILACLSIGYSLGGKLADKYPHIGLLAKVIFCASISVGGLGFLANPILTEISSVIQNVYISSFIASILLFTIPSILLGMVSPIIIRIALENNKNMGAVVGSYSAISCIGSIFGTFLGGFVLVAMFSSGTIILFSAVILTILSFMLGVKNFCSVTNIVIFAILGIWVQIDGVSANGIHVDTQYNHIRIYENKNTNVRYLQTTLSGAQSAMFIDKPIEHVFEYTKFYELAFFYRPEISKVLMLGGGGYTVPKSVMVNFPNVKIDVVELDSGMTEVAKEHFGFTPNEKIKSYHEDARTFINREKEQKYDAIFIDVFQSEHSIPFHLTTVESFNKIFNLLSDNGIVIMNIISSIDGNSSKIFKGIYASLTKSFLPENTKVFPVQFSRDTIKFQNIMLIASKTSLNDNNIKDENIEKMLVSEWKNKINATIPAFTDAFAPTEYYALFR